MQQSMYRVLSAVLVIGALLPARALAQTITFDEFPPANGNHSHLTEEYADLGIHFHTTDDGSTWGGNSNGNPGGWLLEGTNGPAFLGLNGASYSLSTTFDNPVSDFRLDVSSSAGSSGNDTFELEGYLDGDLVDSVIVNLNEINIWQTIAVSGTIDETVWLGAGNAFHPFGIDNVNWVQACDPCDMNCDGRLDAFDIEPFLDLLFDPNAVPCNTCTGDVNGDGVIDAFDIEPFLECLFP